MTVYRYIYFTWILTLNIFFLHTQVSDLNTSKLALRKMMGLMENPDASREMIDKYVSMIQATLLAQLPQD